MKDHQVGGAVESLRLVKFQNICNPKIILWAFGKPSS